MAVEGKSERRGQNRRRVTCPRCRESQLSSDEAVQYLVEILKTLIAKVTADLRLVQSYDAKSRKIELPD
jgi:hypothetical protein